MIYDLSPSLGPGLPVWPGDTPYRYELVSSMAAGGAVNVGAVRATCHLGAHVDAPVHLDPAGAAIDALPLEPFLGPCRVIEVPAPELVTEDDLEAPDLGDPPRLLIRTGSVGERGRFPRHYTALAPPAAARIAAAGVLLVGLDTPSVDPFGSRDLEAHRRLFAGGVAILEGLVLDAVPAGLYELIALPLRLEGADASPVRAILRSLPPADLSGRG